MREARPLTVGRAYSIRSFGCTLLMTTEQLIWHVCESEVDFFVGMQFACFRSGMFLDRVQAFIPWIAEFAIPVAASPRAGLVLDTLTSCPHRVAEILVTLL